MFVPLRGTKKEGESLCPQRRCFAACSGFLIDCVPSGHGAEWAYLIISEYLVIINCC